MALPASPTLTNPDMILPYGEYDSTPSPPQNAYRPEDEDWRGGAADMQFSIGPLHAQLAMITPTTPIIYGNGTMLSDIGEVTEAESTPGRKLPGPAERRLLKKQAQAQRSNSPLRSSPTIGYNAVMKRTKTGSHERKISMESTSTVKSEGQAVELFRDFDDGVSVDDSVFQGDDEESVADSYAEEVIASETARLSQRDSSIGRDDDRNSSAALSRRAEQILLNAKKRLNSMEGNLTRARSVYITPSSSASSIHSSSPLSRATPSPPQNDPRIFGQLGAPPSKHRQLNTPSDTTNASPGHSRVYSENSIQSTMRTTRSAPSLARSASAAGRYVGKGAADGSRKFSPENVREGHGQRPGLSSPLSRTSPPHGIVLEPLGEDETVPEIEADGGSGGSNGDGGHLTPSLDPHGLTRSASSMQMRDLRDQMQDLKGRLSVLRDRARDDTMKRRSLQSLRTPSPFTAAEQWYAGAKGYGEGGLSQDAIVASPTSPWRGEQNIPKELEQSKNGVAGEAITQPAPEYANSEVTSVYEDVSEGHQESLHEILTKEEEDHYKTAAEEEEPYKEDEDYNDELVDREEAEDYESDASLYHDTLATPLSHEDREDAFDYEHFFLHSAMGTISQQRHRRRDSVGSFSSEDSVETTRGPSAPYQQPAKNGDDRTALGHLRSGSTDSVSTLATFATATEGLGSQNGDEEDDDDDDDNFAVQYVNAPAPESRSETPVTAKRSTFGSPVKNGIPNDRQPTPEETSRPSSVIHDRDGRNGNNLNRPSIASFDSVESTGTTRSFPLVNKPKSQHTQKHESSIFSGSKALTEGGERLQPSPVDMLAKEDQVLVEKLVASLGKCVLGLQEAGHASYDGRIWRRRLDAARRILEGEEGAI